MVQPDWHFTLSDGTTTLQFQCCDPGGTERSLRHWTRTPLERTAMKLGSGRTRYDDLLPPWYAIAQDDWAGGRGELNLLDDPTKYADAEGVQTIIPKRLVLGPPVHANFTGALSVKHETLGTPDSHASLLPGMLAQTFTLTRQTLLSTVELYLTFTAFTGYVGIMITPLDGSAQPNTLIQLDTDTRTFAAESGNAWYSFTMGATLPAGQYAIVLTANAAGCSWGYNPALGYAGGAPWELTGSTWADPGGTSQQDFLFRALTTQGAGDDSRVWFYYANGLLHATFSGEYVVYIYRRGQLGQASAAGGEFTLTDASAAFTTAAHAGQVVTLIGGTGVGQQRSVTSVTGTVLTIDRRWEVKPDTTTLYAITGDWKQVSGFGGTVSDVLVVDGITYFARAAEDNLARHRWTKAAGEEIVSDNANHADRLALFRDADNVPCIWRSFGNELSAAAIQPWGTDLIFGTAIRVASDDARITGLVVYDDHLYIGKENGLWALEDTVVRQIPVHFEAMRSPSNCKIMVPWNLYLIFPILNSLERMYSTTVDDFGPNIGRGLPSNRQGPVTAILPLPGLLLIGIDGGPTGYSSVLAYNNLGWHEIARSTTLGARISAISYEVLDTHARLWWNEGPALYYVWMSRTAFDRSRDPAADYASSGTITLSWLGADLEDVDKIWSKVVVIKEQDQTIAGIALVSVDYRLNDESDAWTAASLTSTTATRDEFAIPNVVGRRLQLRLTLTRHDDLTYGSSTPEVTAVTVDALGRISTGFAYNTHSLLDTIAVSMQGSPSRSDPAAVLATLDAWASSPTPLTLSHALPEFTGKTVLLEPVNWSLPEYYADGERAPRVVAVSLVVI